MDNQRIIAFLLFPDAALVEHAVQRANLTRHEWEAIKLREYEGETVESAAERLDVSPGTIKNRYRSGMRKLGSCWAALPWISRLGE